MQPFLAACRLREEGPSLTLNGSEPEMLNVLQCMGQSFIIELLLYQNSTTFKIPTSTLRKHRPRVSVERGAAGGLGTGAQGVGRRGAGREVEGGK